MACPRHTRARVICYVKGVVVSGIAEARGWYYLPRMVTISFKVPDELASRLDHMARSRRTSRSELFREALEEKLEAAAGEAPPSLFERSSDLCGAGSSGIGDLASDPRHLEGFGS